MLLLLCDRFVAGHDAGVGLEEQGRALHAFVDSMEAQMAVHPLWSHLPVDSGRALLVECLERHLTHTLHSRYYMFIYIFFYVRYYVPALHCIRCGATLI
jgi:hypothetical protein